MKADHTRNCGSFMRINDSDMSRHVHVSNRSIPRAPSDRRVCLDRVRIVTAALSRPVGEQWSLALRCFILFVTFCMLGWAIPAGCRGLPPSVGASDPMVFTSIDIAMADHALVGHAVPEAGIARYFASRQSDYDKEKLRIDVMLDNSQRVSAYYQSISTLTQLRLLANMLDATAEDEYTPREFAGLNPADAMGVVNELFKQAAQQTTAIPPDSPFDQLTRVTDFYEEYRIKFLRKSTPASIGAWPNPATNPTRVYAEILTQAAALQAPRDANSLLKSQKIPPPVLPSDSSVPPKSPSPSPSVSTIPSVPSVLQPQEHTRPDAKQAEISKLSEVAMRQLEVEQEYRSLVTQQQTVHLLRNPELIEREFIQAAARQTLLRPDRLVMLVLQTHVDAGNRENTLTDLRLRVADAELQGLPVADCRLPPKSMPTAEEVVDAIKIVRVHPSRPYDLDSVAFGETVRDAASIAMDLTAPLGQAGMGAAQFRRDSDEISEVRRRFMTRLGKQGSAADGSAHEFGWVFLPSNLQIVERSWIDQLGGRLAGVPGKFKERSFLESGGRDVAVFLLVPRYLTSITLKAETRHLNISQTAVLHDDEWTIHEHASGRTLIVELPPWNVKEHLPHSVIPPVYGRVIREQKSFEVSVTKLDSDVTVLQRNSAEAEVHVKEFADSRKALDDAIKGGKAADAILALKKMTTASDEFTKKMSNANAATDSLKKALNAAGNDLQINAALRKALDELEKDLAAAKSDVFNDYFKGEAARIRREMEFDCADAIESINEVRTKFDELKKALPDPVSLSDEAKAAKAKLATLVGMTIKLVNAAVTDDKGAILVELVPVPNTGKYFFSTTGVATIQKATDPADASKPSSVLKFTDGKWEVTSPGTVMLYLSGSAAGKVTLKGESAEQLKVGPVEIEFKPPVKSLPVPAGGAAS